MKAFVKAISYYLPSKVLTNSDLVKEFPEWTVEKVASKIGVNERHIVADDETASDLAISAAEKLFAENSINRNDIDFILLCTQSPDYYLPTSACVIQNKLNLSTSCGALDFNLGCSGFVYGLSLAKGLILANIAKNVLLLTAETYSKHIHPNDKGNRTIFGDAAAATLISNEGIASIEEFSLGTDGRGANNLISGKGGFRKSVLSEDNSNNPTIDNPVYSDYLYMNGSEIFNFTSEAVPVVVDQVLKRNNLKQEEIDLFVFHQANKYMMNYLRKLIEIDADKFYYCLENVGNTVSSTIPIALHEALNENKITKGAKVLLAGFGVGYSWGATVLKF